MCSQVGKRQKKVGLERKVLTVVLILVHRVFLFSFYYLPISLKRYDMVAIIITAIAYNLIFVTNRIQILGEGWANSKK
jgi:hypothetical protein